MEVRAPTIDSLGIVAFHDQACAVYHDQSAVMNCQTEVFYPSWQAQDDGWRLVQARTWFQRLALRVAFSHSGGDQQ
jgi:hypothetical protein